MEKLILGDCFDKLKEHPDNSVDSVVTDPPYGISFMSRHWDYDVPKVELWKEVLRVLKPGGHALVACGTRTQHRMAVNLEDAGFEIRDIVAWIYGSGFPKSLNIGKAIDNRSKASSRLKEFADLLLGKRKELNLTIAEADKLITGGSTMYSFLEGRNLNGEERIYAPNKTHYENIKKHFGISGWDDIVENNLDIIGEQDGNFGYQKNGERWIENTEIKKTTTAEAKQWEGWGTALKPAMELWTLCRKPLSENTVAENVLKWGTGGLNINTSRVGIVKGIDDSQLRTMNRSEKTSEDGWGMNNNNSDTPQVVSPLGRFPANLIHDGSDEVVSQFPDSKSTQGNPRVAKSNGNFFNVQQVNCEYADSGSAARFFYCAKASKSERDAGLKDAGLKDAGSYQFRIDGSLDSNKTQQRKNNHPTVKPIALMEYLIKLITPLQGVVLDPFMGSGSTGIAAKKLNFNFIGIEKEEEYLKIAEARINNEKSKSLISQQSLF